MAVEEEDDDDDDDEQFVGVDDFITFTISANSFNDVMRFPSRV